ncbi:hypothetical protein BAUCODRAFT_146213 [Baudoinia panamericana UAMH 10762]|uniref:Alpha/beta hydrolase fold-3 domain-containing protein n=1 Tax=Baudoinia panamericana (strain UAMH 10762) TaxID=717646 RepID=M2MQY3_BAUPA|nr:uncharacterized protein BAUCODRAFT_146213 [Baudoinia panamericana UAMH 10762]EMC99246.1 hypothetical protein BAUCODRAFT_146213 [Baudoinia panamericana UAMH 10762]
MTSQSTATYQGSKPAVTLIDKLTLVPILLRAVSSALLRLVTRPLTSGAKQNTLFRDVLFALLRTQLSSINTAQEQWSQSTTEKEYNAFMKKRKLEPATEVTQGGVRVHWLGNKNAKMTILFYHGGGFNLAATPGHFEWLWELQSDLNKQGRSVNVLVVSYTLAPAARYPTQMRQAVDAFNWLLHTKSQSSEDIVLMGDSAGANLVTSIFSHIMHPHPEAPAIHLKGAMPAAVLIAPWVKFATDDGSVKRNESADMVTPEAAHRWSSEYLGSAKLDNYNQASIADKEWFSGLQDVVKEILVYGGGAEVLIDSIEALAKKLQHVHPKVKLVVMPGEGHDALILDKLFGYAGKSDGTRVVESWLSECLSS